MAEIFDTNDAFDFNKINLLKPTQISGGNYFIRSLVNDSPLYIQPPKCITKQGILKAGKRFYTDLMFTNENEKFIAWIENLENHFQQSIFNNREKWFDGSMERHDIENYFTSALKLYKSGKFYIVRANLKTRSIDDKPILKIYDELENEVNMETVDDKTNLMTILEVLGIKCSPRSFQIELEVKQMMTLKPTNIFEKCIIKTKTGNDFLPGDETKSSLEEILVPSIDELPPVDENFENNLENISMTIDTESEINELVENDENIKEKKEDIVIIDPSDNLVAVKEETDISITELEEPRENYETIEEVDFHLEDLPETNTLQLKKRNDVYYQMYREARKKAKAARNLALSSYLEAKRIKNTYMLDDIENSDSDDSDLEIDIADV
jgi:hypothetical protein